MKLTPEQLSGHLQRSLLPVYLLSGDEPLLIQEAATTLRATARNAGYAERETLHADAGFQWENLLERANSLSLFSDKLLLELHIPNGKPGQKGGPILEQYLSSPSPDTLLLIYTPRIDAATQKTRWFKAIDNAGATLAFWPVEMAQLPGWINRRFQAAGLSCTPSAAQLLAERVEGNLLAASQEIEKLKLAGITGCVDEEQIISGVSDSARFDVFTLTDAALAGKTGRSLKVLQGLRSEGVEATLVLWSLSREIRTLLELALECRGAPPSDAQCKKHRIWGKRKSLVGAALSRTPPRRLEHLLQQCAAADQAIKGMSPAAPWDLLAQLITGLSGSSPRAD
ncbi:DNA polymerase III subunit delta [Motiliproteus sediminis]|uniref:DNA polymerase III subunit delta n=1 Tax=Motiliproteus sediminis TaxID=1468178 RepID=UPI001AF00CF2|nr:DNA polymerase III subunit delta [Motiliproteus sediminis]